MAEHLSQLLTRIDLLLRSDVRAKAVAAGLPLAQFEALHYLTICNRYSDTPATTGEFLGTTKGTTSQSLRTLETKGLITKTPDPDDARVVHCRPTRAGRSLVRAIVPPPILEAAAETIGDESRAELEQGLESLLRGLQRTAGGIAFGVCHTCAHFRQDSGKFRCGLTQERLTQIDSLKICREHLSH